MTDQEKKTESGQLVSKEVEPVEDKPESRGSTSSDDEEEDVVPVTVETYDEFTEPIQVLSEQHVTEQPLSKQITGVSMSKTITSDPEFEVDFAEMDPGNPKNWPFWKTSLMIFFVSYTTLCVVLYSTSYTAAIPGIMEDFNLTSETVAVLGVTVYLLGLAIGSVVLAPLSEMYGRRIVYLITIALFAILIIPSATAQNLEAILITRFIGSLFGSAMISNAPGSINDMVTEEYRALAFSCFAIGPMNGPVIGPLVGGFVFQYKGWRWTNWVALIAAGAGFIMICLVPETYAPAILRARAEKLRKETGNPKWWSRYDERKTLWEVLKVNLSRPFIMSVMEPICVFWNLYVAVVYGTLYLCFVAYPIVFRDHRGWSSGDVGLAYLGIGIGSLITIALEPVYRRIINSHKPDPETGRIPPEAMVSIVCMASISIPVGEMIFAWTGTPTSIPWIAPLLAGVPFGAGNTAVFIYASNYLVHSYGVYAASALAGNSVLRSLMGGFLPLAGPSMYNTLGPRWAGTLLALIEFALIPIPFVFYKYGDRIRRRSALIRQMRADQARLEGKRNHALHKQADKNLEKHNVQDETSKVDEEKGKLEV